MRLRRIHGGCDRTLSLRAANAIVRSQLIVEPDRIVDLDWQTGRAISIGSTGEIAPTIWPFSNRGIEVVIARIVRVLIQAASWYKAEEHFVCHTEETVLF